MTVRRALLLGGLLLAAASAVVIWRAPLKRKARELWHAWHRPAHPGPQEATLAAAQLSPDGRTLITSDPPPYDRASFQRSSMSFAFGEHTMRPNLHFDLESSGDTTRLSRAQARSGSSAQMIAAGTEYAPAIRRRTMEVADTLAAVAVGLWLYSDAEQAPITIVVSIDRGDKQLAWFGKDLSAGEYERATWQRFQAEFLLRDVVVTGEDLISIYLWNREKQLLYVDDMDVVFRSRHIPGRRPGKPYDLEDRTQGTQPLPFAQVSLRSPTDPASLGISPGQEAPSPAAIDLALASGSSDRLHYVPGDGVARVIGADGKDRAMVRGWCREVGRDLFGFERVIAAQGPSGIQVVGFDVDHDPTTNKVTVAASPAPAGAELIITPPQQ